MLNSWNELIKQESNAIVGAQNTIMYNENDNNNMMLMNGANNGMVTNSIPTNGTNGIPSQAQVAAAVATAMMMQNNNHNK